MFKWIWTYVRRYGFLMFLGLFLSVLVAASNMINPLISGTIVDKVIQIGRASL